MTPPRDSIVRAIVFTLIVYAIVWRVPQLKTAVTGDLVT